MSIFDVFKKPETEIEVNYLPDSEQEAFVGILYACMDADNEISDTEIHFFSELLGRKKLFNDFNIIELYKKSHYNYLKLGGEKIVKQGSLFIKDENKPTLFAVTIEILITDGILTDSEKRIAELLATCLKLDADLSKKIIEVLLIKTDNMKYLPILLLLISCTKSKDDQNLPISLGVYYNSSLVCTPPIDYDQNGTLESECIYLIDDCLKDDKLVLESNSRGYIDFGAVKCPPKNINSDPFYWSITPDNKQLISILDRTPTENDTFELEIISPTEFNFILYGYNNGNDKYYRFVEKFIKK